MGHSPRIRLAVPKTGDPTSTVDNPGGAPDATLNVLAAGLLQRGSAARGVGRRSPGLSRGLAPPTTLRAFRGSLPWPVISTFM
jgi:hypothetical protein